MIIWGTEYIEVNLYTVPDACAQIYLQSSILTEGELYLKNKKI